MARLLLRLNGSPAVLLLSVSLQACVIPLGPDFTDPPAAQNFPPQILNPSPPFLSEVKLQSFQVTVTDPNVGDTLFVRWLSDYPATVPGTTRLLKPEPPISPSADGTQKLSLVHVEPSCLDQFIASGISVHTIVVMVGDHDFDPDSTDRTLLKDGSHAVMAGWLLDLDCPPQ